MHPQPPIRINPTPQATPSKFPLISPPRAWRRRVWLSRMRRQCLRTQLSLSANEPARWCTVPGGSLAAVGYLEAGNGRNDGYGRAEEEGGGCARACVRACVRAR
eukprot:831149-Pyramimonas_sp.AAC.2